MPRIDVFGRIGFKRRPIGRWAVCFLTATEWISSSSMWVGRQTEIRVLLWCPSQLDLTFDLAVAKVGDPFSSLFQCIWGSAQESEKVVDLLDF